MALAGLVLLWNWWYATSAGRLTVDGFPEKVRKALMIRLLIYPSSFLLAMGLSLINVAAGFAVCAAVPLVYIIMQVMPHKIDRRHSGNAARESE